MDEALILLWNVKSCDLFEPIFELRQHSEYFPQKLYLLALSSIVIQPLISPQHPY